MPIESEQDLERAVAEFQRLNATSGDSSAEARRRELDAEIKEYYARCADTLKKGRPAESP